MSWADHQHAVHESRQRVDFEMLYVDMAGGDLIAGLMLAQIDYWHSLDRNGRTRLRVRKDGHLWLAKARHEWWDEIRISPKQADRAIEVLVGLGLIEKKVFRFAGSPTVHIRILPDAFMAAYNQIINRPEENPYAPKGENGYSPKVEIESDQRAESLTEITPETTAETTSTDDDKARAGAGGSSPGDEAAQREKLGRILSVVDDRMGLDSTGVRLSRIREMIERYGIDNVLAGAEEMACSRATHINYIERVAERRAKGLKGPPARSKKNSPRREVSPGGVGRIMW